MYRFKTCPRKATVVVSTNVPDEVGVLYRLVLRFGGRRTAAGKSVCCEFSLDGLSEAVRVAQSAVDAGVGGVPFMRWYTPEEGNAFRAFVREARKQVESVD